MSEKPDALFSAIPNSVLDKMGSLRPPMGAWAVLMNLYRRANAQGQCWPSIATIAEDMHISPSSVCAALKWLKQEGFIDASRRSDDEKGNLSTMYTVGLPLIRVAGQGLSEQPDNPLSGQLDTKKNQLEEDKEKKLADASKLKKSDQWMQWAMTHLPKRYNKETVVDALKRFYKSREAIKAPVTEYSVELMMGKLDKANCSIQFAVKSIEDATEKGYRTVYWKEDGRPTPPTNPQWDTGRPGS